MHGVGAAFVQDAFQVFNLPGYIPVKQQVCTYIHMYCTHVRMSACVVSEVSCFSHHVTSFCSSCHVTDLSCDIILPVM